MVSKFPTTINKNDKIKAVHNAIPSALEGTITVERVAFSERSLAAVVPFDHLLVLSERLKHLLNFLYQNSIVTG